MALQFIDTPPPSPSGWNKYFPITNEKPLSKEREFYFPPNKIPTSKIGVVNEYANFALQLDSTETSYALSIAGTPGMGLIGLSVGGLPVSLNGSISRRDGYLICGGNPPLRNIPAPKFGFSIGNLFKHQVHIKLDITGVGVTGPKHSIVWLTAPSTASIEYSTNCRLEQFVLKHGKVLNVKTEQLKNGLKTYSVKIFNSDNAPEFKNGMPSGEISFYSDRGTGTFETRKMTYSKIDSSWYAELNSAGTETGKTTGFSAKNSFKAGEEPTEETKKEEFVPKTGDFFTLVSPILCDNPQTMHEFNVRLDGDGVYITNEQKFSLETSVIGVWIYDQEKALNVAYADEENRSGIVLPKSPEGLEISPEEYIAKEYRDFGGNLEDGISKIEENASSVKLILLDCGSVTAQNFFSGNLIGEYIFSNDEYYEIVGHPRLDTIEINRLGVTSGKPFAIVVPEKLENMSIKIYQQKFWKIVELYTTAQSVLGTGALWEGKITSLSGNEITWDAIEPWSRLFLPDYEVENTKCKTLAERFRTPIKASKIAYKQHAGWNLIINGSRFKIIDFKCEETEASVGGSDAKVRIIATVEGNPYDYGSEGSEVHVLFGDPFASAYGLQGQNIPSINIATSIGRFSSRQVLYMHGYYDAGAYSLPLVIDSSQRFAVASHLYGASTGSSTWGVPRVWITTYSSAALGVCYLEHGNNGQQTVLYKDPDFELVAAVTADPGWIERRKKAAIYLGLSNDKKYDKYPEEAYLFTKMGLQSNSSKSSINGYFPVAQSELQTPYHSIKVSGYGGIETPLSRKYKKSATQTDSHPAYLPFEVYSPVKNGGGQITISCPILSKISTKTNISKYGFEEVTDGKTFELIKQGTQLAPGNFKTATSFEFVKARQLLIGVNQFNSHMVDNGEVFLFYGKNSSYFLIDGDNAKKQMNKPSVFVIKSSNNMESWGSPKVNQSKLKDLQGYALIANDPTIPEDKKDHVEWEHAMMLLYDFEFVSSLKLWDLDEFLIFGYGHSRQNETEDPDNKTSQMFLGCYLVTSQDMENGTTKKCVLDAASENTPYNDSIGFYYRPHHVKPASDSTSHNMDFGVKMIVESTTEDDKKYNFCEKFTKIIGGKDSGALIGGQKDETKDWMLPKETIGVECTDVGVISVYFREAQSDSVMRVWSCTHGSDWILEVEDYTVPDSPPIKYATGSSPTIYKGLLFYFYSDSLYCKSLIHVAEGSFEKGAFGSKQEQIDKITPNLVASDVVGHKIAVNTDPYGMVVVFYLNKSGDIQAATSNSNGITWTYLNNW